MNLIKKILSTSIPSGSTFDLTLLIYRVLIAFAMIRVHGYKKIVDFEGEVAHMPDPLGLGGELNVIAAIAINIFFAAFVGLGFLTRLFSVGIISLTLIGFFVIHINDPWPMKDSPMMYSIAFGMMIILGPGKYSIDQLLSKKLK